MLKKQEKVIKVVEEGEVEVVEGLIEDQALFEEAIDEGRDHKNSNFTPMPEGMKEKAWALYLKHTSYDEICRQTGMKKGTLLSMVARHRWSEKRKENDAIILNEMFDGKKVKLEEVVDLILDGSIKAIQREAKEGFKVKDLPVMLAALSSVEKLSRLTQGKATSISEERSKRATVNFTPLTSKQIPMKDPFAVSPKELTEDDDTSSNGSTTP